jgi:hypothetical protein
MKMYQLFYLHEAENLRDIPPEVIQFAKNALSVLDEIYGRMREKNQDGGEVIILSPKDNLNVFDNLGINVENLTPEYSNIISTSKGVDYLHIFTLSTNEYSRQILMPKDKASLNLIDV